MLITVVRDLHIPTLLIAEIKSYSLKFITLFALIRMIIILHNLNS